MQVWVVVDVGCMECGEDTEVLGVYPTKEQAEAAWKTGHYFTNGEHNVEIHESEFHNELR